MPGWDPETIDIEVLSRGWANKNYLVKNGDERYVVKILTQAMGEFGLSIPREDIMRNTELAGGAGVGARVVARLEAPPALVLEYLHGRTLEPEDIRVPAMTERIGRAIARLHRDTQPFENDVSAWDFINRYLELVDRHGLRTPDGLLDLLPMIGRMESALVETAGLPVPSQVDTYAWNLIDVAGEIRIIDYDFSGMTDECFDVGDAAMEGDLDPDETARLVESYFGGYDATKLARVQLFGIAAQYMWSLLFTGMAQLLPELPSDELDYWGEASLRWEWVAKQVDRLPVGKLLEIAKGPSA
ncbi:MAG TPA: phosphotransferase [Acidimicrobiales bacterium]|nr:phosphotransferase [Acidimicrobiales bacterium]